MTNLVSLRAEETDPALDGVNRIAVVSGDVVPKQIDRQVDEVVYTTDLGCDQPCFNFRDVDNPREDQLDAILKDRIGNRRSDLR